MNKYITYEEMTHEQRKDIITSVLEMAEIEHSIINPQYWSSIIRVERPCHKSYRVVDKQVEQGDEYYDASTMRWTVTTTNAPCKLVRPVRVAQLEDYYPS